MSGFVSEPTRSEKHPFATSSYGIAGDFESNAMEKAGQADMEASVNSRQQGTLEVDISAGQKMLSAVSGSLLTSLLVTPLDVVRVRLQSQPNSSPAPPSGASLSSTFKKLPPNLGVTACCREVFWMNNNSSVCLAAGPSVSTSLGSIATSSTAECAIDESRRKTFSSTLDGLQKIARNEGVSSLWRGLSPTLLMAIPANVIYFTGYDHLRHSPYSPIQKHVPDNYAPLIAGSIARVAAAAVISPIEMFRTRMQAAPSGTSGVGVFKDTLLGLQKLVHAQGYTSLWRGLTLTMWRDVPFSGIYWWGYESVRNNLASMRTSASQGHDLSLSRTDQDHAATFIDSFIAGAVSGAFASIITTPFDVGKTRQQVLENRDTITTTTSTAGGKKGYIPPEERSMPRFLHHIWKSEGPSGLFRGWAARCLKVAPACAIMISSYEIGKKMARAMNERKTSEEAS
ncbi:MAG: hypothetical protein Q9190_006991 [Brigantiaea leucoxantha]